MSYVFIKKPFMISSYPKAGSTYIRFFLLNYLEFQNGNRGTVNHKELNKKFPEIGKGNVTNSVFNFLVKTHHPLDFLSQNKILRVVRNPYESLCSTYEYYNRSTDLKYNSIEEFLLSDKGVVRYEKHLELALKAKKHNTGLVIQYEKLMKDPKMEFCKILNFLNITVSEKELDKALAEVSRESMKRFESQNLDKKFKNFSKKKDYSKYEEIISSNQFKIIKELEKSYSSI